MKSGDFVRFFVPESGEPPELVTVSSVSGPMVFVARHGTRTERPLLAMGEHVEPWECWKHGHHVDLWRTADEAKQGFCVVCSASVIEEVSAEDNINANIICPTCEGTGWAKSLHQRMLGHKGDVPCPTCKGMDADT